MSDLGDDAKEKPLDPATERLRRKMMRLLAIAVATLMLGVMAVLAAIVYKLNAGSSGRIASSEPIVVALPADVEITGSAVSGGSALLTLAPGGPDRLVRIDLDTGAVLARYRFSAP